MSEIRFMDLRCAMVVTAGSVRGAGRERRGTARAGGYRTREAPLGRRVMRMNRLVAGSDDHVAHQPAVGMVEHVAVIHPVAGPVVETHDEPGRLLEGNVHRVLPGERSDRSSAFVECLEEEAVQVKR